MARLAHRVAGTLATVSEALLDGIFPPMCLGCYEKGTWLCASCLVNVPFVGPVRCLADSPLDALVAVSAYAHPITGTYIRAFKYQRALCLRDDVGRALLKRFAQTFPISTLFPPFPTLIVPIPMDPDRKRTRGLDHAYALARLIQEEFFPSLPLEQALLRVRATETNASLPNAATRAINIAAAFSCEMSVEGHRIVLIDDVYTSGATMKEAAKVLKSRGAVCVMGCVMAYAEP